MAISKYIVMYRDPEKKAKRKESKTKKKLHH
ncbi:hypothetical protein DERF_004917 [Dermatophagoides farinae]|uniref:Uncharacterized protein n=1 Tax=Dermatophagoides farinae TaxID=6954 RepID=A0A922L6N0_DERFA|nr:hypothetical protein DERF_004917 [Dermatophagoides farinae]